MRQVPFPLNYNLSFKKMSLFVFYNCLCYTFRIENFFFGKLRKAKQICCKKTAKDEVP